MSDATPFWGPDFAALTRTDPEIAEVVLDELDRLRGGLQLIASTVSPGVRSAAYAARLALAPECGWRLAWSAPKRSFARAMPISSARSTTSQPP